jgi:AraC family transcriptional activator of pyochelin receptor
MSNSHWRTLKINDLPSYYLRSRNCLSQHLPDELGFGSSDIFRLDHDLSYIETRFAPAAPVAISSRMDLQEPRLVVTLGLTGKSRFVGVRGEEIIFTEGYTTITAFNSSDGERQYEAEKSLLQMRFSVSKSWLDRYFGEGRSSPIFAGNAVRILAQRPISSQALTASRQLMGGEETDDVGMLLLHGQSLLILSSELSPLFENEPRSSARFNARDKAMASLARDILFEEFRNPPPLVELAVRVGTNPFKIKQIFRHYFNQTPYGLLFEFRMEKAYRLLEATRCHVGVAADHVGYHHASNFSTAFFKHFGISPKQVAKR